MKRILIALAGVFLSHFVQSQTITCISTNTPLVDVTMVNLPKSDQNHLISTVIFKIGTIGKGQTVSIKFTDKNEGSAEINTDYQYVNNSLSTLTLTESAPSIFKVDIKTLTGKKRNAILYINANNPGKSDKVYKVIFNLNSDAPIISQDIAESTPDTAKWSLRIITGGNFDFFNGPKIKDFAGDINLFLPNIWRTKKILKKERLIGIQFNLFNYHYYESDSSGRNRNVDNYYANSQDYFKGKDSAKVVTRSNSTNTKVDYNIWGASLDPMLLLARNDFSQFYLSLHFEALITTQVTSYNTKTISRDTTFVDINDAVKKSPIGVYEPTTLNYLKRTYYDYYFGFGLPLKVNVKNKVDFSISPTIGVASIQHDTAGLSDAYARGSYTNVPRGVKGFFLTKFQLVTSVAPVDIAMGGEYRAVYKELHYLSLYIGAAIALDKLKR